MLVGIDAARQVARIDVVQPGLLPDLGGADQGLGGRVFRIGHFIVPVEGGHVPGDVVGNRSNKARRIHQFIGAVVETGDHQCDYLDP